jgi:hypothetical protein
MDMHSLETLESQKSKLMNQVLALFLHRHPLSFDRGHFFRRAWNFLLGRVLSPARSHELAF